MTRPYYLICQKCGNDKPKTEKIGDKWREMTNRKFCTVCSPIIPREYRTDNNLTERAINGEAKECSTCGASRSLFEYIHENGKYIKTTKCRKCFSKRSREKTNKHKTKMKEVYIKLKGGECISCGYNKSSRALEFHHLDPEKKDFIISDLRPYDESVKELEKCILLCANCHREEHGGFINIKEILNGKNL